MAVYEEAKPGRAVGEIKVIGSPVFLAWGRNVSSLSSLVCYAVVDTITYTLLRPQRGRTRENGH